MSKNKTIQMLIFNGNPNGRIMCDLSNWNGRVYKISRNEIKEFAQRQDSEHTGVYFLLGKDENNNDTIYVGEAEKISSRLKQHFRDEEYWNDCIIVTSRDNSLNKAHIKYLENKFYLLAKNSGRSFIVNNKIPTCSSIDEYDESMLEEFISNAKLLVNTLGYKVFDSVSESAIKHHNGSLTFSIKAGRGAEATGTIVADGFAIFKNSTIASAVAPSISEGWIKLRNTLIEKNIINSNFIFVTDYVFASPSAAASLVLGRNANGRTKWKTKENKTLKDIEEESILT